MIERAEVASSEGLVWDLKFLPCPVCRVDDREIIGARGGRAHRAHHGVETNIARCSHCGVLYPYPTPIARSNPYGNMSADAYFVNTDSGRKLARGGVIARQASSLLGRTGRMLELGCGRGELLEGARSSGWEVSGVEMTAEFATVAQNKGLQVECATIDEARLLQHQQYDFVLLEFVLEHLYQPMPTLKAIHDVLVPGGALLVVVPNEEALALRVGNLYTSLRFGDWCVNLSPTFAPFHVLGFSPKSLPRALTLAGFEVGQLDIAKGGVARSPKQSLLVRIEEFAFQCAVEMGQYLAMGDILSCWARRPL